MNATQAIASGGSTTLPSLSLCQSSPRKHSRNLAVRVSGKWGARNECQGVRVARETKRRMEVSAEAGFRGGSSEELSDEGERRDSAVSAEADSSPALPFALYSVAPLMILADASTGYSQASYNTTLGLFLLSLPGVWSLVKRATKSKIVKKTFNVPGPAAGGKSPKQIAAEITSFFTRNNFTVKDRSEVVVFEGVMTASRGQAAFLTFCTFVSLGSAGLVLSIANQDIGQNAYYITLLSPLAGVYYWRKATRTEQIQVKIVVADDETSSEVVVQGDDEQIDRMRRELELMEKGMVYVKGILEQ
ncbi:protein COFACTOR ASSEMBLY OF COMPLEX C SUBUNIT B CCB1, chloroplastic [Physcomitrium patens]|uniref:Uncharacterized protein n=1 Tax=Physcomitrium patens TaxID=3218 RepID=A0A2K1L0Y2_PHYPA|nr:protein COFACTOR ASSEMBLY OF COMPLEX C SUBUNIT B CCB1, chloroplastic-like [Physcomitrium patens]PNR59686.1 hypothetical protein PHYPA_002478 [Physcomitrium patens]|eukprot:XP_024399271.1 protein COFACTOR ASSEMBLY OF COMPLEX C SUBUNIT B CCB1, chloroplastic-like [Physcomitrella patens]